VACLLQPPALANGTTSELPQLQPHAHKHTCLTKHQQASPRKPLKRSRQQAGLPPEQELLSCADAAGRLGRTPHSGMSAAATRSAGAASSQNALTSCICKGSSSGQTG
jgi:hypothetical protein